MTSVMLHDCFMLAMKQSFILQRQNAFIILRLRKHFAQNRTIAFIQEKHRAWCWNTSFFYFPLIMILYVHSILICLNYVDSRLLCKFQVCIMHVLMKNEPRFPGKALVQPCCTSRCAPGPLFSHIKSWWVSFCRALVNNSRYNKIYAYICICTCIHTHTQRVESKSW